MATAVEQLAVSLGFDPDGWQRAVLRAFWTADRLSVGLGRARQVIDRSGYPLTVALWVEPLSRCELAAQRRVEQAMRLRARRAARRARRAAGRAARAAS